LNWRGKDKVTVAYTFLFQSDVSARSGFRTVQERTNPSECSMRQNKEGKILLRVTRELNNSERDILSTKDELVSDLERYGGEFQNWKYHVISINGKTEPIKIKTASKFLAWLTPPGDARNYQRYKMPFYSIIFVLVIGFIIVLWV
jgi:hypothetical protein